MGCTNITWQGKRTLVHRANNSSVCDEHIQTTKVSHSGGYNLLRPHHVPYVGGEDEDLGGGVIAEDRVSPRLELCLTASHQRELGASAGVLERDLGTDTARCACDQHHLARECLRVVVHLGIDSRIDTWDYSLQPGATSKRGDKNVNVLDLLFACGDSKIFVEADR